MLYAAVQTAKVCAKTKIWTTLVCTGAPRTALARLVETNGAASSKGDSTGHARMAKCVYSIPIAPAGVVLVWLAAEASALKRNVIMLGFIGALTCARVAFLPALDPAKVRFEFFNQRLTLIFITV